MKPFVETLCQARITLPSGHVEVVSREQARQLAQSIESWLRPAPTLNSDAVVPLVAAEFGILPDVIYGSDRYQEHVIPRQVCMWIMHLHLGCSSARVGRHFSRDHGTVLHACGVVSSLIDTDPHFKARVERIRSALIDGAPTAPVGIRVPPASSRNEEQLSASPSRNAKPDPELSVA